MNFNHVILATYTTSRYHRITLHNSLWSIIKLLWLEENIVLITTVASTGKQSAQGPTSQTFYLCVFLVPVVWPEEYSATTCTEIEPEDLWTLARMA